MLTKAYEFHFAWGDVEMYLYDDQGGKVGLTDLSETDAIIMEALRQAAVTRERETDAIHHDVVDAYCLTFA